MLIDWFTVGAQALNFALLVVLKAARRRLLLRVTGRRGGGRTLSVEATGYVGISFFRPGRKRASVRGVAAPAALTVLWHRNPRCDRRPPHLLSPRTR